MAADMAINLSQLQELVNAVQETHQAQTVRLADGVVAVVMPEWKPPLRRAKGHAPSAGIPHYTLEQVFGAVPTPPHLQGQDIDDIIRDAKEDRAERMMRNL